MPRSSLLREELRKRADATLVARNEHGESRPRIAGGTQFESAVERTHPARDAKSARSKAARRKQLSVSPGGLVARDD